MPSPEHEQVVAALAEAPVVDAPTVAEQRANYDAMLGAFPIPDDVQIEPVTIGGNAADWISVPASRADRVILYLHGGGYVIGSNTAYREFGGRLARTTRARVCVLNYRLAPEHPFPAAVDDARAAYRWILEQGLNPASVLIAGDSAGGGLTVATLLALRDAGDPLPAGGVCISPWVELDASARVDQADDPLVRLEVLTDMAAAYAGDDVRNPLASPVHADLQGLPPLHVVVGTREILLDDARRIAEKARAAGVTVEYSEGAGLIHVWPVLVPNAPESADSLARIAAFADHCWG